MNSVPITQKFNEHISSTVPTQDFLALHFRHQEYLTSGCLTISSAQKMSGYVYTQDKDLALRISRQLKTENVTVNGADYVIAEDSFGDCKNSGISREHGKHGLRELCIAKLVALK